MQFKEFKIPNIPYHETLNPLLWTDGQLLPDVRFKLLKIAQHFINFINVHPLGLEDITISGSNASYGYSTSSDIDLHLIVKDPPAEFRELFAAKKTHYNSEHDITIHGIDVELYVQPKGDPHHSAGIYSVLDDKWIVQPKHDKPNIDGREVRAKARNYASKINQALKSNDLDYVKRQWADVKKIRQSGLEQGGEYSVENLAFKLLRSKGKITKLHRHLTKLQNQELSLEESLTPKDIHNLADKKGVAWDNDAEFLQRSKRVTGKSHLDDMNSSDLKKMKDDLEKIKENFADGRKFVKPNFDFEWEEAERYPEFVKLGKDAWIELARKGKAVTINSAKGIDNTDAADPDSFKSLVPAKQKRALAQLEKGTVEMPIVAVYSDGHKELVGGNTRLTAMMARDGKATVWAFRVPGKQGVAEGNEINRAVEDLVQQVDFVDIVYKISRQKYPQAKFEKLDDMRIQVDVSGENNDPFDYKNYQGFFVMGMTYSNDEGTEVGVLINDAYSGPYKGIILPAIKLATEKCLQLVPNATPTLWVDDDESGGIWNEIAKKLGYKFEILNEGKQGMAENFADGKNPQDKGDSKRHGVPTKASVSTLRKVAKQGGRKGQLAHWMANMKAGKKK
jgi:hypothetical protein